MKFKDFLEKQDFNGSDHIDGFWVYDVRGIRPEFAGLRPVTKDSSMFEWLSTLENKDVGLVMGYSPLRILEWGIFLDVVPEGVKCVVNAAPKMRDTFEELVGRKQPSECPVRILMVSDNEQGNLGEWADLFEENFVGTKAVSYIGDDEKHLAKLREFRNLRLLTKIADDVAIIEHMEWIALHNWTDDQRHRFAKAVCGRDVELPENPTNLEAAIASTLDESSLFNGQYAYKKMLSENAVDIVDLDLFGISCLWDDALMKAINRGFVPAKKALDTDRLIELAQAMSENTDIGPQIEALHAGVPIDDILA